MKSEFQQKTILVEWGIVLVIFLVIYSGCRKPDPARLPTIKERAGERCPENMDRRVVDVSMSLLNTARAGDTLNAIFFNRTIDLRLDSVLEYSFYTTMLFTVFDGQDGYGIFTYRGRKPYSNSGIWRGNIRYKGEDFDLKRCLGGEYSIARIELDHLAGNNWDGEGTLPDDTLNWDKSGSYCPGEVGSGEVDLMVLYTDSARMKEGSALEIEMDIVQAVARTNLAFGKSGFQFRLYLNHVGEIPGTAGNLEDMMPLKDKVRDIHLMEMMKTMRGQYHADLVVVILKNGTGTDIGYARKQTGYAVMRTEQKNRPFLFAHEIGHLLGAEHDTCSSAGSSIMAPNPSGNRTDEFTWPCPDDNTNMATLEYGGQRTPANRCYHSVQMVFLPDFLMDTGVEPSMGKTPDSVYLFSPLLYCRHEQDMLYQYLYQSEGLQSGANFIYTILRNGGVGHSQGFIDYYYSPQMVSVQDTDLVWIGRSNVLTLPPEARSIVEARIDLPANYEGKSGLLAIWQASDSEEIVPIGTGKSLLSLVTESNRISARAGSELFLSQGGQNSADPNFRAKSLNPETGTVKFRQNEGQLKIFFGKSRQTGKSFIEDRGTVNYSYLAKDPQGGKPIFDVSDDRIDTKTRIALPPPNSSITNAPGGPDSDGFHFLTLYFFSPSNPLPATYPIHIEQWKNGDLQGSFTFELHTETR